MLLALIALGVWQIILTLVLIWGYLFFRKLTKGIGENQLDRILTKIMRIQEANKDAISLIQREIRKIEEDGQGHVQKIGIVRFNPFKEIGGDHSFSLAALDGTDSGVIVTCLHTRERTRVYMKEVKRGKCDLELSAEEKKVLEKAT